ncbi:hypothetical protein GV794_17900 [Nocardia cyriacigeorgica]|uniref:DUF7144 domain-containing protein n=1 Tax=Nocardia cyriacigeorgica TaxID=135487 RepID=A0A6P1D6T0_9NOCA|nr:hypothetical protein [Nocardia cyriacigeorgica]NEW38120.1 hypothetical protein [Nocardia cyriacigeorgica]NEW45778.1 hypothetical protein [Nocardia cyriacigeorgica]NEW48497.1 hypothetical protein [Nocardia cyriacigeorgica]NEW57515.1 hypothetical protein [Nocardia cyriacigeorgica]
MTHSSETESPVRQGIAAGTSIGAAILLLTVGVLSILQGISAVAEDQLFVVGIEYVYEFDTTTWGWIHIALGIILVICALGLMTGTTWGRVAAVAIAALSIIANFLWLPYYPAWSILIIVLNVVVIWAVTTWNPSEM